MNKTILIGRLTKDPDLRFAAGSGKAVTRFSLAINRPMKKDEVDFINCIAFGKTGETIAQYMTKGSQIALEGRIQTGSYEKDGITRYTTDIIVDRFEFCGGKNENTNNVNSDANTNVNSGFDDMMLADDGDIPF